MTKNRVFFIDFLRTVCVIYIVGFWHLMNYTDVMPAYNNNITARITVLVLGLFVFLSGYLLAKNDIKLEKTNILNFYKRRVLRIYPLYVISILLFVFFNIIDRVTAFKAVMALSMFYGPSPPTLWFVTMLIIFYLFTPVLVAAANNIYRFIFISSAIFCVLLFLIKLSPGGDLRLVIYFPSFVLGILCARRERAVSNVNKYHVFVAVLFGLTTSYISTENPELSFISIALASIGSMSIYLCAANYREKFSHNRLTSLLSFCGFAMYLLHRPIYQSLKGAFFPSTGILQLFYLGLVCLPIIVFVSWVAQRFYDKVINIFLSSMQTSSSSKI